MKSFTKVFTALFLCFAMCVSMAGCSAVESFLELNHGAVSEEKGFSFFAINRNKARRMTGANGLTYPDHIATYDEIHPYHEPGDISGDEASDLLDEIELSILSEAVSSYVDAVILFDEPENYGIEIDEVSWGEIDTDTDESLEFVGGILDDLYSIDYESLDTQDRLFYDKVLYDMEEEYYADQFTAFSYMTSIFNPLTGPQCEVLFILHVVPIESVEDAENYILLLEDLDRYYDDICTYEEERAGYGYASTDDLYEQIAESFDNLVAQSDDCFLYQSFEDRLDNIRGLSDADRTRLIEEHEEAMQTYVFPEFEECAERMRALEGSGGTEGGLTQYEGGQEYFALRYRALANSSMPVEESIAQLDEYLEGQVALLSSLATAGDYSWFDEYMDHSYTMGDTNENLEYLSEAIAEDFPELPEHSYSLIDVPEALEDNFSPAAYLGFRLDRFDSNLIITNNSNVDENFGVTCAHEGYPGHMFQSVYTRSVCEHPYMYIADSTGYAEGWATYVENYSHKYFGENETAMALIEIENELNVLIMARIDAGINYEGWDIQDCADFYSELVGTTISTDSMQEMYDLMTIEPGYAVKYGVGYVNTTLLINSMMEEYDVSDQVIHATYLEALPGTFEQIEAYMDEQLG